MLRDLEDDDVETMLESTFSIIIQHWPVFDEETRVLGRDVLKYLLKHRTRLIRMSIVNLPSLSQLDSLEDIDDNIEQFRRPTDTSNALRIFSSRLRNENAGVVHQALVELKKYLHKHQSFVHASAIGDQPDPVIAKLTRAILDTCIKFNRTQNEIPVLSLQCMGLVGCLDPNRVESPREQHDMVVVSNFKESSESTDFVLFTFQHVLVPVFLSTTDTALQGFFSYSMQQLLEVCDFRRICGPAVRSGQRNNNEPLYEKWQALPSDVRHTLTPFLTSKYAVNDLHRAPVEYPIFGAITDERRRNTSTDRMYGAWLRTFTADLLSKPSTIHAQIIFPALSRAIRIRDTTVAHFLLPYLILHVVLEGTDKNRGEISEELLSVLLYRMPHNSRAVRRDEWRSCLEVG
jgi:serine/threonine-protein kinase ATR